MMDRIELERYITERFGVQADHPWMKYPGNAVFRHSNNRKWFALVMDVSGVKLGIQVRGSVSIVNVKCDPILIGSLLNESGFYPAYHMNKNSWVTAVLDEAAGFEKIKWLLEMSYDMTDVKVKKKKT